MAPAQTQTQTAALPHTRPNRPQDYIYDPVYTVPCKKDHDKAIQMAFTHKIGAVPIFPNMFSTLHNYPAISIQVKPNMIPTHSGQDRTVFIDDRPLVTSQYRYKFFKRPLIPYVPNSMQGGSIVYAKKASLVPAADSAKPVLARPASPFMKTRSIQTLFRESEAQTDPYTPEYVLAQNSAPPELLALATLTYKHGLPAGVAEIEMIDRARAKRAWEASLPEVTDQASFEKRLRMMEEMELQEWKEREDEIQRLQDARLAILRKVIMKREEENEDFNQKRIEKMWNRKLQEREALMDRIDQKRIKALRKLADKRSKLEKKTEPRDIITDYANHGSRVYAPKLRDGLLVNESAAAPDLTKVRPMINSLYGLEELEYKYSNVINTIKVDIPNPHDNATPASLRKEQRIQDQLKIMDMKLKERKSKIQTYEARHEGETISHLRTDDIEELIKPLRFYQKIEKPPQRPATPSISHPTDQEEQREIAALFVQKIIRGRLMQDIMYQGKERRLDLVNEVRTRHLIRQAQADHTKFAADVLVQKATIPEAAEEAAALVPKSKKSVDAIKKPSTATESTSSLAGSRFFQTYKKEDLTFEAPQTTDEEKEFHVFEALVGAEYVGKTLDFLTKELARLREARRIDAMVKLAERTRRMREAEESGRRQAEIRRRDQEDVVFREVMKINRETVDTYLEDIILESVDITSSVLARTQVHHYATKINAIVDDLEKQFPTPEEAQENTVRDLVASFLIPEVEKQTLRQIVQHDQQKYVIAAHEALQKAVPAVENAIFPSSKPRPSQAVRSDASRPVTATDPAGDKLRI